MASLVPLLVTAICALIAPATAGASDSRFSLRLDEIQLQPRLDPKTEARRAMWNDPMGRLVHQFHQQQSWIMRGTAPGSDRTTGAAVRLKAQNGLPLNLVATMTRGGLDLMGRTELAIPWPWSDDEDPPPLDEQIAVMLGERLAPVESP